MREHLYRAKRKDDGKWTEGYLYKIWDKAYILWGMTNDVPDMEEVVPDTICEYTGLTDKNGKKIFEGDIVKLTPPKESNGIYVPTPHNPEEDRILKVVFFDGMFAVDMSKWFKYGHGKVTLQSYETDRLEVIGNIFENPELLQ